MTSHALQHFESFLSQCNQIHDFGTPLYSYESSLGTQGNIYASNNKYIQGESKKV